MKTITLQRWQFIMDDKGEGMLLATGCHPQCEVRTVGVECKSVCIGKKNSEWVTEACGVGLGRNAAVLVLSGCYNRKSSTRWLLNNRNLFLTVLEAESTRSRLQQIGCLIRAHIRRHSVLTVSSHGGRARVLSGVSFIRRALSP